MLMAIFFKGLDAAEPRDLGGCDDTVRRRHRSVADQAREGRQAFDRRRR